MLQMLDLFCKKKKGKRVSCRDVLMYSLQSESGQFTNGALCTAVAGSEENADSSWQMSFSCSTNEIVLSVPGGCGKVNSISVCEIEHS